MSDDPENPHFLRQQARGRLLLAQLTVGALALVLGGCASPSPDPDTGARGLAPGIDSADCDQLAAGSAPPETPRVVLIVDHTATARSELLAPAAVQALQTAQRSRQAIDILAVDGKDVVPRSVLAGVALDPRPDDQSPDADNVRSITLACVQYWSTADAARPTSTGSDVLAALSAAARQHPALVVVASDGIASAGGLDFTAVAFSSTWADLSDDLAGGLPELVGVPVLWTQLGESDPAMPPPVRAYLTDIWTQLLRAAGAVQPPADTGFRITSDYFDTRTAAALPNLASGLPEDPADFPIVSRSDDPTTPAISTVTIPDALLFAPDSANLAAGADTTLRQVVDEYLPSDKATARLTITGHSAGTQDDFAQALSEQRAAAVRDAFAKLGVPGQNIIAGGVGATDPADPTNPFAPVNRRVTITVTVTAG